MSKRRHHYLSRFYLGGFTASGKKDDRLYVRAKSDLRRWSKPAEEVAHQRDLFRPNNPEFDPDFLEDAFADIEDEIAPVLKRVTETSNLPDDARDLALLLHLPALNASRPPAEIRALEDTVDDAMREFIVEELTPEYHAKLVAQWIEDGRDPTHIQDLGALKERIAKGSFRVTFDRDTVLTGMLGRSAHLVDLNLRRYWTLLIAPEGCDFICCDRPVALLNNQNVPPGVRARFDDPRFDVIMPLSRTLCLVGRSFGQTRARDAGGATVGFINHIIETGAEEYVYSSQEEYLTKPPDNEESAAPLMISYTSDLDD